MNVDLVYIYQSFLESQGIQFLLLNDNFDQLNQIDFGFRKSIYADFDYGIISHFLKGLFQEDSVIMLKDRLQLDYCIFHFPKQHQQEYNAVYGIIGPVIFKSISSFEIKKKMKEHLIPDNLYHVVAEFHNRLPILHSVDIWHAILRPFICELFGNNVTYQITSYNESMTKHYNETAPPNSTAIQAIEDRYYIEQQLINAVKEGDKEKALDWHRKFKNFRFQPRAADEIRQQKNLLLVLNTLLRKAIQDIGIHPFYIDQISQQQAIEIEYASTLNELEDIPQSMIRKYCLTVKNHNLQAYSTPVERSLQYIEFFYMKQLTLDELARHCFVTPNYLSSLFKKEIGINLKEYINQTRIHKSLLLLNTTHLSIQEIAQQCGFADGNYFTRLFKKYKGLTPVQYRKHIHAEKQ